MSLLQFHEGSSAVMQLASNEQAITEINESLGLGLDQYLAQKKVEMLNAPLTYLTNHNTALFAIITKIGTDFDTDFTNINNLLPDEHKNTQWVWQMAADAMGLKGLAELKKVDRPVPHQLS